MTKTRLEAFSDGVFAIAITILILEVTIPHAAEGELWDAVLHEWPQFAAYFVSFFILGIMWVNHHALVDLARVVDRGLLFINLFFLLFVVTIPFTTELLAEYIRDGDNSHIAAAIYSATMFGCSIGFQAIWWYIAKQTHLLHKPMEPEMERRTSIRFGLGVLVYLGTIALSFVSARLTLAVHFAIALYYMFDQLIVGKAEASS